LFCFAGFFKLPGEHGLAGVDVAELPPPAASADPSGGRPLSDRIRQNGALHPPRIRHGGDQPRRRKIGNNYSGHRKI